MTLPANSNPVFWLLVLWVGLAAVPADAHKLKLFAAASGSLIEGYAYFPGGGRAVGCEVTVTALDASPDGRMVTKLRTDATGGFRFEAPRGIAYRIEVDSGDGHQAQFTLETGSVPAPTDSTPVAPGSALLPAELPALIERAVAAQVVPLRQALDRYEERVRFSDLAGGIGAIVGLFGIAGFILGRRRDRTQR